MPGSASSCSLGRGPNPTTSQKGKVQTNTRYNVLLRKIQKIHRKGTWAGISNRADLPHSLMGSRWKKRGVFRGKMVVNANKSTRVKINVQLPLSSRFIRAETALSNTLHPWCMAVPLAQLPWAGQDKQRKHSTAPILVNPRWEFT